MRRGLVWGVRGTYYTLHLFMLIQVVLIICISHASGSGWCCLELVGVGVTCSVSIAPAVRWIVSDFSLALAPSLWIRRVASAFYIAPAA